MKFGALLGKARHLYECEAVATGHYARRLVVETAGRPAGARSPAPPTRPRTRPTSCTACARTSCGTAASRWATSRSPRSATIARGLGLVTADKPESQEICFVPGGDYREELRVARRLESRRPGRCWTPTGRGSGSTAAPRGSRSGQRKGLGVALGRAALRVAHRPGDQRDRARPARGPRDDADRRSRAGRSSRTRRRRAATRTVPGRRSGRRCGSAIGRRSSTRRCGRRVADEPARGGALDGRDGHAGLGDRARPGLRAVRRRHVPRRRADRGTRAGGRRRTGRSTASPEPVPA